MAKETQPPRAHDPHGDINPRDTNAPALGGSFEENGQTRLPDGIGAGPGLEVLDQALQAAKRTERHSSAGRGYP